MTEQLKTRRISMTAFWHQPSDLLLVLLVLVCRLLIGRAVGCSSLLLEKVGRVDPPGGHAVVLGRHHCRTWNKTYNMSQDDCVSPYCGTMSYGAKWPFQNLGLTECSCCRQAGCVGVRPWWSSTDDVRIGYKCLRQT